MSSTKRYITNLTEADISALTDGWKNGKSHLFRCRCHCIIMSLNKHTVSQIATFFNVQKHTVYAWLNRWEKGGLMGLHDKPGRGRKPLISLENKQHAKIVDEAVQNAFEKGTDIQEEIVSKTQLIESFSKRTLRRLLKKKTMCGKGYVAKPKNTPRNKKK